MFFLSDYSADFARKKGAKDRFKRNSKGKKKVLISDDTKNNIRETRSTVNTGLQTANTVRGVARETRNWIGLANKLGII